MTYTKPMPHFDLVDHPTSETIKMLTGLLERITKANDQLFATHAESHRKSKSALLSYNCFHARSIPTIDIHSYLVRILKYCPCSNECFLSLLVYFDRMSRKSVGLRIDSFNIHRLIISGVMLASKFFSDVFYTNARYAKVGGLPVMELNALELEFLQLNDFNINVKVEELQQYGDRLLRHWIREEERRKESEKRKRELLVIHKFCSEDGAYRSSKLPAEMHRSSSTGHSRYRDTPSASLTTQLRSHALHNDTESPANRGCCLDTPKIYQFSIAPSLH